MSRKKGNLRELGDGWVSIKKMKDRQTLQKVKAVFEDADLKGSYHDKNIPDVSVVVRALRRQGVKANYHRRKYDDDMIVIFLKGNVPVCGTMKGFFWRFAQE